MDNKKYVSNIVSLGLLLYQKGPTMSFSHLLLLAIFAALYINTSSTEGNLEESIINPTPDMLLTQVRKTKNGWFCAGVYCPKKNTASCKTTSILKPTEKIEHDLVVLCLNATNYPFCGITRSSRVVVQEIVELGDDGNMEYVSKERITTREGISIPYCPIKSKTVIG
ncbi:uncharacterized protein LOC110179836 [Drosophila serrata]|uniref:uncharacterized protein LOC110179836 n=1 Tax=Drosophila serrata TaxID=7274 RepID=UPI000A1D135F|nr:uncharacterized protein LOC110179836 [Drosophila serrata]